MRIVAWPKVEDTCFSFSRLLTKIFEDSGVPLEGMYRTNMKSIDTITSTIFRFIKMNLGVAAHLQSRKVDEELIFKDYQPELGEEVPSGDKRQ